ncbi:MAG: hypothetical protein ABL888_03465 [Pirellulaceae bacterium]
MINLICSLKKLDWHLSGLYLMAAAWVYVFACCNLANAQPAPESPRVAASPTEAGNTELDMLITSWVLDAMPHTYTEDKTWGRQEVKNTRLRLRMDPDGKVETYRQDELVNHGDWSKFTATLVDPKQQFQIQLQNVQAGTGGEMLFDVVCSARMKIDGRQAKWVKGIQLYSVGAEGSAEVQLTVSCAMRTSLDVGRFPPDLIFAPRVTAADVLIKEFQLDHVGKFGGEVAQQITRIARNVLDDKVAEKEEKLVEKLNGKIEKNRHKLRISSSRAAESPWAKEVGPHLEPEVQKSLSEKIR